MSIRQKILIPLVVMSVVCSTAILASSVWLFNRGLEDAARAKIHAAAMYAEHELEVYKNASRMAAVIVAEDPDVVKSVIRDDHDEALYAAGRLLGLAQVDFCTVLDSEGLVLARTHDPDNYGGSLYYQHNVEHALAGEVTSVIERGTAVLLSVRTGAPVIDDDGNTIGVVSTGYRLDIPEFTETLGVIAGCEVTLFMDDVRISTTIRDSGGNLITGTNAEDDIAQILDRVYEGEMYIGNVDVSGNDMIAAFTPIHGVDNEIVGILAVGSYTDDDMGRVRTFIINALLIFAVVLTAAIVIAIFISNTIEHRINTMIERIRESEKLELALEHAENSNKAKTTFMANMSHEIRTPLNVILGITEMRLRDEAITGETREELEKIYDSGKLLLNIVSDILDHSKIEAGKLKIMPVEYNVPWLISDAAQLNRLRYDDKPIELHVNIDPDMPLTLKGDALRIKQILNNLISNAYKYTELGDIRLTVCTEAIPGAKHSDDVCLKLIVSDTGQGMSQEQLEKLYEEYTRFNLDVNRTTDGVGLGMNITKHIIELMGGEIHVESEVGESSVFTVKLPQKRVGEDVCGSELAQRLRNADYLAHGAVTANQIHCQYMPHGCVLIVDDVKSNLYVTSNMLRPYGLRIDMASSGFEAIERIKRGNEYDIIFMDYMMPKMDGIETTKMLRGMGYTGCIIALTANAIVGQAEIFLRSGFDDYISKPLDSHELDRILHKHIRDSKSSADKN